LMVDQGSSLALDFMVFHLLNFGLTEVHVKKPERPTRKGKPHPKWRRYPVMEV
jgi:hypothetical protein